MNYWHDAFPTVYERPIDLPQSGIAGAFVPMIDDRAFDLLTVCSIRTKQEGAHAFDPSCPIDSKSPLDSMPFNEANFIGRVWKDNKPDGDPVGFICWTLNQRRRHAVVESHACFFDFQLAYVNRGDRGHGYGRYLALAVTHWLGACRVNGDRCVSKGVEVFLHSDFYSNAGAAVFYLIKSEIDLYYELRRERRTLPWKIRSVFDESGF